MNNSNTRPDGRLRWVDDCKGICIVLVVYGHVVGGLVAAGTVLEGTAFERGRNWVYLFHMPAFFFLSGLFASRALGRPLKAVLSTRLKTLAYPYVLWTGIYLLVQMVMARYANNAPDTARALRFLWEPYGYGLWFLYSLFLISILFHLLLLARLPKAAVLLLAVGLYVAAAFNVFGFWPILNTAMLNFIFYALGGLYSAAAFTWFSNGRRTYPFAAGIIFLVIMTMVAWAFGYSKFPISLLAALLGVAGIVCIAKGLPDRIVEKFFCLLGFYSLEIYLGHPLFSTAARAVLNKLHVQAPWVYVVAGVLCGVFISLTLAVTCRRLNFPFLYRWPVSNRGSDILKPTSA